MMDWPICSGVFASGVGEFAAIDAAVDPSLFGRCILLLFTFDAIFATLKFSLLFEVFLSLFFINQLFI